MEKKEIQLAKLFHDTYERLAPEFGYTTRPETREFDENSSNGKLMIAVCKEVVLEELDKAREEGRREYARELLDDYYQPDSDSIEIDVSEIQSELSKLTTK
jgi:hypothetical protein